jgi:hypothetical protein
MALPAAGALMRILITAAGSIARSAVRTVGRRVSNFAKSSGGFFVNTLNINARGAFNQGAGRSASGSLGRNQSLNFLNSFKQKILKISGKFGLGLLGSAAYGLAKVFSGLKEVVSSVFYTLISLAGTLVDFRNSMANLGVFFNNSIMEPIQFASFSILTLEEVMKKFQEFPALIASLGVEGRRQFAEAIGSIQQDVVRKSRLGLSSEEISSVMFELAESIRSIGLSNQISTIANRESAYQNFKIMTEISSSFATSRDAIVRAMRSFSQNVVNRILMANFGRPGAPMTMGKIGGMGFGAESQQALAAVSAVLRGRIDPEGMRVMAGISALGPRIGGEAGMAIRQSLESLTRSFGARSEDEANRLLELSRQQLAIFASGTAEEFEAAMGRIYDMMRAEPLDSPLRSLLQDAAAAAINLRSRASSGISREEMGTVEGRRKFQENLARIAEEDSKMAEAANTIRNVFTMLRNFIRTLFGGILDRFNRQGGVFERITKAINALTNGTSAFSPYIERFTSSFESFGIKVAEFLETLGKDPSAALDNLKNGIVEFIKSILSSLAGVFKEYIAPIFQPLIDVAKIIGIVLLSGLALMAPQLFLIIAAIAGITLAIYGLERAWEWVRGWLPSWLGGRRPSNTPANAQNTSENASANLQTTNFRPETAAPNNLTTQPTSTAAPRLPAAVDEILARQMSATPPIIANPNDRPQNRILEENRQFSRVSATNIRSLSQEQTQQQTSTTSSTRPSSQPDQNVPIYFPRVAPIDRDALVDEIQKQTEILDDIRARLGIIARNTG